MDQHKEYLEKAKKNLLVADHMAFVTYKVVQEPRLLLSMLENLFLAFTHAMSSLLYYERMYKRVPLFADNFDSKFRVYKDRLEKRHKLDPRYAAAIKETKDLLVAHKKSPVEFSRAGRLVICSDDYRLKSVNIDHIKGYLAKAKLFIEEIGALVDR
jgi:hypothetical protein